MAERPLTGIRVLDLTRVLAGPFCSMILRDLGAEVIKIEAAAGGDDARRFGPFLDRAGNKSAYFISVNCGKKSLALDLKRERGKRILAELIGKSDVLLENFRPGTLHRLGFSAERIAQLNRSIVYASASGFGHSGPDSGKAAYDVIIQALGGLMSITGTEDGRKVRVGTSIADILTGMYAAIGIVAALLRRERKKKGARVDVAMLDSVVSVLENAIARYQAGGELPGPIGSRHPSIAPFQSFTTSDSEIVIAAGNDKLFALLCQVLGRPGLAKDTRFKTNPDRVHNLDQLREILNAELSQQTTAYWLKKLEEKKIPCAPINTVSDLFASEQLAHRNMLIPVPGEGDFRKAGNPIKFGGEPDDESAGHPPALGEHNREILREILGYSDETIAELYDAGVLSGSSRGQG